MQYTLIATVLDYLFACCNLGLREGLCGINLSTSLVDSQSNHWQKGRVLEAIAKNYEIRNVASTGV